MSVTLFVFILKEFLRASQTDIFGFCIGEYFEFAGAKSSETFQNITAFKDYANKYCLLCFKVLELMFKTIR